MIRETSEQWHIADNHNKINTHYYYYYYWCYYNYNNTNTNNNYLVLLKEFVSQTASKLINIET